jgi:tetrahydromethanopterin S-methyltransferase subunit C
MAKRRKAEPYAARQEGKALVLAGEGDLPAVCLKCGSHEDVVRRAVKLAWTPLWARALMFCVVGLVAAAITRRVAELAIPLCVRCNARWSTARTASLVGGGLMVIGFFAVRVLAEPRAALVTLVACVAGFVALTLLYVRPRTLHAQRITETELFVLGVDERAAQEIVAASK